MEPYQFDLLSKAAAGGVSRRRALRLAGGGGIAATLLAAIGRDWFSAPVGAQGAPCTLTFRGTVRIGSSAGQLLAGGTTPGELRGQLAFTPDTQGAIGQGQLQAGGSSRIPVVGQIDGRAIHLRMTLDGQQVLVAVGTAAEDLTTCQGAVDGLLTGPQPGDLGDWHGTLSGTGMAGAPGMTTASGSNPPAGTTPTTPPGVTGTRATTPTTTTSSQPIATTAAQPTATTAPTASVTCPACQIESNGACVPAPDGTACSGGACCGGQCYDSRQFDSDPANCGGCGHSCPNGQFCSNGVCGSCAQLGDRCSVDSDCCSGYCNEGGCDQRS